VTRLLIADDHPIMLDGVQAVLRGTDFKVVARCTNGAEVLEALGKDAPDIIILDIKMPKPGGLEILRALKPAGLRAKVLLLTANIEDDEAAEAMRLGVGGLVMKETAPRQLLDALNTVRSGGRWIDSEFMQRTPEGGSEDAAARRMEDLLTPRERDIARLVELGLRNKDIARQVLITEGTVKMHLHNIYSKLGLQGRTELALHARGRSYR
jgi:two-component system nitrate/nitrite response regulator NarP